jgi:5-formyltetrahydrofolate cyclo-ligase
MTFSKDQIRKAVWDRMEREGIESFPGARGRIPNFGGTAAAADRLAATEAWRLARALKCNPDAPQRPVRFRALRAGKTVFMAVPRLRELRCFVKLDPARIPSAKWRDAASIAGSVRYGVPVHPRDVPGIDLVIAGSVAVNARGQRIGKGGGYSDLEWALGREFGFLKASTPVATTVHPVQVSDQDLPVLTHDVTVNLIVTPEEVITVQPRPPKPRGVDRRLVTAEMLAAIPILAEILGTRARKAVFTPAVRE